MKDIKYFHVETQVDGQWGRFTCQPIFGEEAANEKLLEVCTFAIEHGHSALEVRLHEKQNRAAQHKAEKHLKNLF